MEREDLSLSRIEAERIISILEDTTEKLGFLDRFVDSTLYCSWLRFVVQFIVTLPGVSEYSSVDSSYNTALGDYN